MNCIKEFDYDVILQEKFALLQNVSEMVLSTSVDNNVTSRVVSTACYGPRIIFLSRAECWRREMRITPGSTRPNRSVFLPFFQAIRACR